MRKMAVLMVSALLVLTAVLPVFAGGGKEQPAATQAQPAPSASAGAQKEAPMLAEQVAAGKLPALAQRLPENPVVVQVKEIGSYGGRLRRFMFGSGDIWGYRKFAINEPLFYQTASGPVPNMAAGYSYSKDGLELTINLRKGLKWSDGTPFTSEDIRFIWEDDWMNKEYRAAFPGFTEMKGKPIELVVIDDWTFKFVFPEPNASLLSMLAAWYRPATFLKKYHPKYNTAYTDYKMYENAQNELNFPDFPVTGPWVIKQWDETQFLLSVRNPYYFKVDQAGNQLPYIDEVFHFVVKDAEVAKLKIVAGEIDAQTRHLAIGDYTLLKENESRGNYATKFWVEPHVNPAITLNYDTPNAALREYIANLDFRIALSVAIDRDAINDVLFNGLAKPYAATFTVVSPFFDKETYNKYAYFNANEAKTLLDKVGLVDKNKDGFRDYPDGQTVQIVVGTFAEYTTHVNVLQFVKENWEAVGIKTIVSPQARALIEEQFLSGSFDAICLVTDGTDPFSRAYYWTPKENSTWRTWSVKVKEWYSTNGQSGRKPFAWETQVQEAFDKGYNSLDAAERIRLGKEIGRIHALNVTAIGLLAETPVPFIHSNKVRNTEDQIRADEEAAVPAQWFFAK